ncbi:MAG: hypothetical protein ABF325_07980 [Lentimonas sp.]
MAGTAASAVRVMTTNQPTHAGMRPYPYISNVNIYYQIKPTTEERKES